MKKEKIINLSVSNLINTKFRDYALYVLTSRGIPSFYDSLTPIQRYILMNTPSSFSKTVAVVGKVIQSGYHHGSASVESSISRLARPFGNSFQLLEGYGFFGTEVTPNAAAARYTSVKMHNKADEILKRYNYLNTKSEDSYDPFWIDIPIGLTQAIIGIAVGYKTMILPRKLDDIKDYLAGKRKSIKPFFKDFKGTIKRHKEVKTSWILKANLKVENKTITVTDVSSLIKFSTLLNKIEKLINEYDNKLKINNNSDTKVNLEIIYTGIRKDEFREIKEKVDKITSIIVSENVVFIKDSDVLVYDNLEEYLDDYKWQILRLRTKDSMYLRDKITDDILFNESKKKFITFMLQKKRSLGETDTFLSKYSKDIKTRLENLTSKRFTSTELTKVTSLILELKKELIKAKAIYTAANVIFKKAIDPTIKRGTKTQATVNLLEDFIDDDVIDGIDVYKADVEVESEDI